MAQNAVCPFIRMLAANKNVVIGEVSALASKCPHLTSIKLHPLTAMASLNASTAKPQPTSAHPSSSTLNVMDASSKGGASDSAKQCCGEYAEDLMSHVLPML